ncbi:hypothetical protein D5039_05070 [Verminephrobacter aporrectodeae subsp. tuberculatae]|uniref:Uncharacterized protein n=1 Tax=Verminephrobacter aporrectodeae subsp. tuberculatae TaxID=1110392 RepID=A0ABT3KQI8_9BURK|nr:hypothetical protein [Verminephrobacter aporrectodeae]MCW5320576.1 hypothetical protein [Verminephrobacter aporrectodeae subsp. tuberculatae]
MSKSKNKQSEGEGGDALIHLRVSATLKARWVRESRTSDMRLTTWIIERVEREGIGSTVPGGSGIEGKAK